jgi:hypothetical protein
MRALRVMVDIVDIILAILAAKMCAEVVVTLLR